ncbi:MAG: hypothetical protein J7L45_02690 [Candidatus Aenigmarchaeota archaeon]|nr:hypothetical protein [Candidatus Aenigmarchaeota archaeon]
MREEIIFASVLTFVFLVGYISGAYFGSIPQVSFEYQGHNSNQIKPVVNHTIILPNKTLEEYKIFSQVKTHLVAVDQNGNGVVTNLTVRAVPGKGKVLVDVESLLFWVDTQQSIQLAKRIAEKYLGKNITNLDLTYTIDIPNATIVGGPSAGGAFTVATIAALENKTLRNDTIMTGTIEPDGSIGKVGGILAKARAAKEAGFKRILVPKGQANFIEYGKDEHCERYGSLTVCNVVYKPIKVDVGKEIGINVIEVSNITEAVKYFISS